MLKILCNNPWEGVCFMMNRRLQKEGLTVEQKNMKDDGDFFRKHKVMSCPLLLVFEDDLEVDRIKGIDDIIFNLKTLE